MSYKLKYEYHEYKIIKYDLKNKVKEFTKSLLRFKSLRAEKIKEHKKTKQDYLIEIQKLKYDKEAFKLKNEEFKNYKKTFKNEIKKLNAQSKKERLTQSEKDEIKKLKKENKKRLVEIFKNNKLYKKDLNKFQLLKKAKIAKEIKDLKSKYKNKLKELNEFYNTNYKTDNGILEKEKVSNYAAYKKAKKDLKNEYIYSKNIIQPNKISQLWTVVRLNLSDRLGEGYLKNNLVKTLAFYIAGLGIFSYFVFFVFSAFKSLTNLRIGPDQPFIKLLLFFVLILSVISSAFTLTTNLYEDKHNKILMPLPLSKNLVYFSKLISSFLIELKKSGVIYFSLLMGYGMTFKIVTFAYLFKTTILCFIFPIFTILLGQFLSIFIFFVRLILNKIPLLNILIGSAIIALIVILINKGINHLSPNGEAISLFRLFIGLHDTFNSGFGDLIKYSYFSREALKFLFAERAIYAFGSFIRIFAFIIVLGLISYLNSFFYYKIYDLNTQGGSNIKGIKIFKVRLKRRLPIFLNYLSKELKEISRDKKQITIMISYVAVMPLLFYFLNKFFFLMNLSQYGQKVVLLSQVFLGLLILTSANVMASTIITREGSSAYLLKSSPRNVINLILAKLFIIFLISFSIITFSLFLNFRTGLWGLKETLMMHIIFLIGTTIHIIWAAEFDIFKSYDREYAETEVLENNKNIARSISLGIIFSLAVVFLTRTLSNIYKLKEIYLYITAGLLFILLIYRMTLIVLKTNTYIRWAQGWTKNL